MSDDPLARPLTPLQLELNPVDDAVALFEFVNSHIGPGQDEVAIVAAEIVAERFRALASEIMGPNWGSDRPGRSRPGAAT